MAVSSLTQAIEGVRPLFALDASEGFRELARPGAWVPSTVNAIVNAPAGRAFSPNGIGHAYSTAPTLASGSSFTLVATLANPAFPSGNPGIWRTASGGGNTLVMFQGTTGLPWVRVNGAEVLKPASGPVIAAGIPVTVVVRVRSGSSAAVFWDGVLRHSATHAITTEAMSFEAFGWQFATSQTIGPFASVVCYPAALSDGTCRALSRGKAGPVFSFAPQRYYAIASSDIILIGANAASDSAASTGTLTQTHALAGASAVSASTSSTAAASQTHILVGANAASDSTSSTAALTQTHALAGANAISASTASTGAVSLTADLIGANAESASAASAGALTQTHVLVGVNAESASEASAWVLVQVQTLAGVDAIAATEASTGAVHGAETILEAANAEAATEASTGAVHTFEVSPSFAADFVADFAAAAKGTLTDRAVWRSADGSAAALDGFFDQEFGSDLNSRAQPAQCRFALFEADDPGVAIGDSLVVGGVEYAVAHRQIDRAVGEIVLQLQRA